jgi:pimeloyl-ACP methyl ester carboxylesterase
MALFALVHGAWHGAWCWEPVIPELESRGHRAVAMDMPIDDPDAGWSEYADAVDAAIGEQSDDVILVGHSMAGYVIPVVAERRGVTHSVFLASLLPVVGKSLVQLLGEQPEMTVEGVLAKPINNDDGSMSWEKEPAIDTFYHDCPRDVGEAAADKLRRQSLVRSAETFPITSFPNSPSTYIVCTQDRIAEPGFGRRTATDLGMSVIEMDASHSPFLSKPAELADILVGIA